MLSGLMENVERKWPRRTKLDEGCYRKKHGVAMRNIRDYRKNIRRSAKEKERTFTEAT